jgi:hypothetical protein
MCIAAGTAVSLRREDVTIVNADIDPAAAIAYSKLNLAGSIVNADISGAAAIALSKLATDPLARANHTGTQLANTISNFDTQVRTSRLDQMAAPTAAVNLNGQRASGAADATANGDLVTLQQLSSVSAGKDYKESVALATTGTGESYTIVSGSVTSISGLAAGTFLGKIDGVEAGGRILIKSAPAATGVSNTPNTTQPANGIYQVTGGTSTTLTVTRATDADAAAEVSSGLTTWVEDGTTNSQSEWTLTTTGAITLGTTALTFAKTGTATQLSVTAPLTLTGMALALGYAAPLGVAGGNLTITGQVPVANGGTGSGTAAGARTNLSVPGRYSAYVGDAVASSFTISQATHGLRGDAGMIVQVYDVSAVPAIQVEADVTVHNSTGAVTVSFTSVPTANQYLVVIVG